MSEPHRRERRRLGARGWSLALALGGALACGGARGEAAAPDTAGAPSCRIDADCGARGEDWVCDHGECMRWWKMKGPVPEISPEELARRIEAGEVQLLDVRTPTEWYLERIEGAYNVPIGRLEKHADALDLDPGLPVVAICLTAHRSIAAVRLLSRRGYDIVQLEGGMTAWRGAKMKRISGRPRAGETRRPWRKKKQGDPEQ